MCSSDLHCEERSDEAIQKSVTAQLVILNEVNNPINQLNATKKTDGFPITRPFFLIFSDINNFFSLRQRVFNGIISTAALSS